jgi:hypothetical protein
MYFSRTAVSLSYQIFGFSAFSLISCFASRIAHSDFNLCFIIALFKLFVYSFCYELKTLLVLCIPKPVNSPDHMTCQSQTPFN